MEILENGFNEENHSWFYHMKLAFISILDIFFKLGNGLLYLTIICVLIEFIINISYCSSQT